MLFDTNIVPRFFRPKNYKLGARSAHRGMHADDIVPLLEVHRGLKHLAIHDLSSEQYPDIMREIQHSETPFQWQRLDMSLGNGVSELEILSLALATTLPEFTQLNFHRLGFPSSKLDKKREKFLLETIDAERKEGRNPLPKLTYINNAPIETLALEFGIPLTPPPPPPPPPVTRNIKNGVGHLPPKAAIRSRNANPNA